MPNQSKTDRLYMDIARRVATESYCQRRKVGCVIVTPTLATVIGYNGAIPGSPNVCELPDGTTDPAVIHAEHNALLKAEAHGISLHGATCYVTMQPCQSCASRLVAAGVSRVVYHESYRCDKGLTMLNECGILVEQIAKD
jgi:dCMP deaminase